MGVRGAVEISDIEFADIKCVFLDEFPAWFDGIPHEHSEDFIGGGGIFHPDLQERAFFRVHAGIPEFFGVHFAETFEAGDDEPFFAEFAEFFKEIAEAGERHSIVVAFNHEGINRFGIAEAGRSEVGDEESVVLQLNKDVIERADFVKINELCVGGSWGFGGRSGRGCGLGTGRFAVSAGGLGWGGCGWEQAAEEGFRFVAFHEPAFGVAVEYAEAREL
jgi:hypothetical protein